MAEAGVGIRISRRDGELDRLSNPTISYYISIGERDYNLCVGEARASKIDGRYLLEMTKDITMSHPWEDDRRFKVKNIVSKKENIDKILYILVRDWANQIKERTGLEIIDLPKKERL